MPVFRPCGGRGKIERFQAPFGYFLISTSTMNQLVLTYQLPAIEMHATKFSIVWLSNVNVKRLALVNVCATICCHLEDSLLGDFPHSFIQLLQIIWDIINVLKRRGKIHVLFVLHK